MSVYQCSIITPAGKVFDQKITALSAHGVTGSFGILGMHAPMVVVLSSGPMNVKQDGKELFFALSSGILEVNAESNVTVFADFAIKASSFEEAKDVAGHTTSNY